MTTLRSSGAHCERRGYTASDFNNHLAVGQIRLEPHQERATKSKPIELSDGDFMINFVESGRKISVNTVDLQASL